MRTSLGGGGGGFPPPPTTLATTTTTTVPATTTTTVAPTTTTSAPPAVISQEESTNWSGYELDGGPFASVSGTFTVPYLTVDAQCDQAAAEWVGIDGASSSDLFQAGVTENEIDLGTGECVVGSGYFYVYTWSEELPAPETIEVPIASAGDTVTVTLSQVSAGEWSWEVYDQTTGQSDSGTEAYDGPDASVECSGIGATPL